jgi:uncharacterized RDD family membrane protein YckC
MTTVEGLALPPCPICSGDRKRARRSRLLYGADVCRRCANQFASRRQGAFLLDLTLLYFANLGVMLLVQSTGATSSMRRPELVSTVTAMLLWVLFCLKDGSRGQSPGKWLTDVRVVNGTTMSPIDFRASFVRNLPLFVVMEIAYLLPLVAGTSVGLVGALFSNLFLLVIAGRLIKGPRWGDKMAGTKVVWVRYAHRPPFDMRGVLCGQCGYDLRGNVSGVCPECGTPVPQKRSPLDAPAAAAAEAPPPHEVSAAGTAAPSSPFDRAATLRRPPGAVAERRTTS